MRCFTCGEVLGDKWVPYITAVQNDKTRVDQKVDPETNLLELRYIDVKDSDPEKSIEGRVLDELGLHKYCCRRMMLTNVHAISYLS
jgi:DNA-directed RNA polymerase subunit N (RpoN/RPB10)